MFAKPFLAGLLAACLFALPASAATLVAYTSANGDSLGAEFADAGITAENVTRGEEVREGGDGRRFNTSHWMQDGSKSDALDLDRFLLWSITSTQPVTLSRLMLGYSRSQTGPKSIALDVAVNGTDSFTEILNTTLEDHNTVYSSRIDLGHLGAVTSAQFRLSGWDATHVNGRFRLEDIAGFEDHAIVLTGASVATIPLPPALPLLGAGVLLLAGLRLGTRRRGAASAAVTSR